MKSTITSKRDVLRAYRHVKGLIEQAPRGTVRMMRVERDSGAAPYNSPPWGHMPTPACDMGRTDLGVHDAYEHLEKLRRLWGDWQCASTHEELANWWPAAELAHALRHGDVCRVLEVPVDRALCTGRQYILDRKAAEVVFEYTGEA